MLWSVGLSGAKKRDKSRGGNNLPLGNRRREERDGATPDERKTRMRGERPTSTGRRGGSKGRLFIGKRKK